MKVEHEKKEEKNYYRYREESYLAEILIVDAVRFDLTTFDRRHHDKHTDGQTKV